MAQVIFYECVHHWYCAQHSLRNMYKELMGDIDGFVPPDHGYLAGWAVQGQTCLPLQLQHCG